MTNDNWNYVHNLYWLELIFIYEALWIEKTQHFGQRVQAKMNLVQLVLACLLVVSSTIDAFSIHSEPCDFNGFQTHPKSCRKYIECVNGWTMVRKCPKGLQFNVDTNRCDWKRNVDCDHGQRLYRFSRLILNT